MSTVKTFRRRGFLSVALAATVVSLGGLAASTLVKSPAEVAAESQPPPASTLTATVRRRVLAASLVTRGTVAAATQVAITPGSTPQGAAIQVVTAVHTAVGRPVAPGDVLVDISSRPLIVLPGAIPAYRDLAPGDDGADIAQLQAALRGLGDYAGGDPAGHFGPATKTAVTALYRKLGYDVATTGGPHDAADQDKLQSAQQAVDAARQALSASGDAPQLAQALRQAQQAQASLLALTGPMVPLDEVAFVPAFPARVVQLSAQVGGKVTAPLVALSTGPLQVTAQLAPDQGQLLKPGMRVQITSESLGKQVDGTVSTIGAPTTGTQPNAAGPGDTATGAGTGNSGDSAPYVPVTVTPAATLDADWAGQDVRLTITSAATPTPVLVVPLSAVSEGADGRTTVSKVAPGGRATTEVDVRAGMSADGFVAVDPVDGGLAAGDQVVVGR